MDFRRISAARRRLRAHMSAYGPARHKMTVQMWSEKPLVVVDLVVHTVCGQCYGILSDLHANGLNRIKYPDELGRGEPGPRYARERPD